MNDKHHKRPTIPVDIGSGAEAGTTVLTSNSAQA
jgi:hypothetical protein